MEIIPSNLKDTRDELERLGINTKVIYSNKTYVIKKFAQNEGFLNPYNIKNACLEDLLNFCRDEASNKKEMKRIEFIEKVLNEKQIQINDYFPYLSKDSRKMIQSTEMKEVAINELEIFLFADPERARKINSHRKVLINFKPSIYAFDFDSFNKIIENKEMTSWSRYVARRNFKVPHTYRLSLTRNKDKLMRAVKNSESCLLLGHVREHCDDAGTLNFIVKVDGKVVGYERLFTCVTDKNEPVLVLDNIECHSKQFEKHIDDVIAMGLAAINLMFDANFKYLIGEEGRVSFGLRQAFSNLDRNFSLKKIGNDDVEAYSFYRLSNEHFFKERAYVLMENWRR